MARFQEAVRRRVGGGPTDAVELVLAHIEEALNEDDASTQKAAFLVTALVHAPDMLEPVRSYYRELLDPLRSEGGDMHEVRHALLAVEGIFLLRGLGFVEVSADEQKSVLLHARDIVIAVFGQASGIRPQRSWTKMTRSIRLSVPLLLRPQPPGLAAPTGLTRWQRTIV